MEDHELKDILVLFNPKRSQQYEFKRCFVRTLQDVNIDKTACTLNIRHLAPNSVAYELKLMVTNVDSYYFGLIGMEHMPITVDDLEDLNIRAEKMILTEETRYGIKDRAALESLIIRMDFAPFGHDARPTIIDKATYLWYTISTKQMFWNGNKRTALLTAIFFLKLNGYTFSLQDVAEEYNISVAVAEGKMTSKQLHRHIEENVTIDFDYLSRIAKSFLKS
ncbi:type II toxin-antitoxin system death-on-curing family toxin [Furfurilactobacillus entadae]|uniref:type II toxin-antitoxin system death-on-curing family toxin n=1 Tax=Furfurilactobacillus entadae TaxID=2922307 RepID=UPI0035E4E20D